jgi:hypothetical protein
MGGRGPSKANEIYVGDSGSGRRGITICCSVGTVAGLDLNGIVTVCDLDVLVCDIVNGCCAMRTTACKCIIWKKSSHKEGACLGRA